MEKGKTNISMDQNVCALLGYLFGWIGGLIIFLLEKENKFVRFHALQYIILTAAVQILGWIPFFGWALAIAGFVFWIICMVKSYNNEWFKAPIIGNIAAKQVGVYF